MSSDERLHTINTFLQDRFLAFGEKYPDFFAEIRVPAHNFRHFYPLTHWYADEMAQTVLQHDETADVYYSVLPRYQRDGSANGVRIADRIWVDIDGGEEGPDGCYRLFQKSRLPKPNLAIKSGNGLHLYWHLSNEVVLASEEAREDFKRVLRRFVVAINVNLPLPVNNPGERIVDGLRVAVKSYPFAYADMASAEPARILRIPGTHNHKYEHKPLVKILRDEKDNPLSLIEWRKLLPVEPAPVEAYERAKDRDYKPGERPKFPGWLLDLMRNPTPKGLLHKMRLKAVLWLYATGRTNEEIDEFTDRWCQLNPSSPRHKSDRMEDWAAKHLVVRC